MKPLAFCCILIDKQNNAIQANMDINNIDYFNPLFKPRTVYKFSNFICEITKPYHQTLENKVSLKFRKITRFNILMRKESEFLEYHCEFIAYNQLASKVRYRDENSKMISSANSGNIVEFTMWDELAKQFNKAEIEKISPPIIISVSSYRVTNTKGVRFTCEVIITTVKENRDWNYPSCSQCSKGSTQQNRTYTCEDHGKQDPPTYRYNFKATVTDTTGNAQFTFFTHAGEKVTGHPCSKLMQKYKGIN
ncbi:nucleic acid-binding, OB-fold protein [Tanacetum coccineum]